MKCRKCGGTVHGDECKLCEMFAEQRAPSSVTDREFMYGTENGRQFAGGGKMEMIGNHRKEVAEKMGQSTKGKKYISQLARFVGDPEAWVDGRGDVQRVLEKRGWGSEGSVKAKLREKEPPKPVALAEDLIQEKMREMVIKDPGLKEKPREELREKVLDKHTPSWKKRK